MAEAEERRRYTRIEFDGDAVIEQNDNRYAVHLLDISLKGALVETPGQYSLKTDQTLTLKVALAGDLTIVMTARLAHSSDKLLGFHCESIGMESITHLRRLIELNLEDPRASERVLDELLIRD